MIAVWIFGLTLSFLPVTDAWHQGWFHAKFALVIVLSGVHGLFAGWVRKFRNDANTRPARFYRLWNEVPTVLMIAIVILAVVKPF
jgi:protoporphyrinogen IX oxidase